MVLDDFDSFLSMNFRALNIYIPKWNYSLHIITNYNIIHYVIIVVFFCYIPIDFLCVYTSY